MNGETPEPKPPPSGRKIWDIRGVMVWTIPYLKERGITSARLEAELLLCKVTGLRRIELYTQIDRPLAALEQQSFGQLLRRRLRGEPLAYIFGEREFMGWTFKVGPAVLIPRPETELLVEAVLAAAAERAAGQEAPALRILEVGVGSGCIAISLALALPSAAICAWELSREALSLARENAKTHGVADRIDFVECDALAPASWRVESAAFDLLVSNPPYIAANEKGMLEKDVRDFEPGLALFGGEDGLDFYRVMARYGQDCLRPSGRVFFEIGCSQKNGVTELLAAHGWQSIGVVQDYSRKDRIVSGVRPA